MIENMKIAGTMLGYEDHGILTFWLTLSGNGTGVGYGGYSLDEYDPVAKRRVATGAGFEAVAALLRVLGVSKWEDVRGQFVRAETTGLGGAVKRIGHLIEDRWLDLKEHFENAGRASQCN